MIERININMNTNSVNLSTMLVFHTSFTVRNMSMMMAIFTPQKMLFISVDFASSVRIEASRIIARKGGMVSPSKVTIAPVLPLSL